MRTIHYSRKKLRGIPRRLRALRKWAASFSGYFPSDDELAADPLYWAWKIPVCNALVEGNYTTREIQRECAQLLIDACTHLMRAKPSTHSGLRVTCSIALPDMFSSELCIYLQESYFLSHTSAEVNQHGEIRVLDQRSLAAEWGLNLPEGVLERGIHIEYPETDTHGSLICDLWFFGEVAHG